MMYRHGDLLLESIGSIPKDAIVQKDGILAHGEATGHAHRVVGAAVLDREGIKYISVVEPATVVHQEHSTIELPPGQYVVTRQREYDPFEKIIRQVAD